MKTFINIFTLLLCSLLSYAQHEHHQTVNATQIETKTKPKSPRLSAMAMIGGNHVHIDYGSPSVRGRNIWNGLVAYNQVWASGAHKATWIDFSQDVTIDGTLVPKGKYGFFTIPGQDEWTLIISKTWDMHLADDYDQKNDLLRLKVKPNANAALEESLTYEVLEAGIGKGKIKFSWEKLNVVIDFENK